MMNDFLSNSCFSGLMLQWAIFTHCLSGVFVCQKIIRSSGSLAECNKLTVLVGFGYLPTLSSIQQTIQLKVLSRWRFWDSVCDFQNRTTMESCAGAVSFPKSALDYFFLQLITVEVRLIRLFTKTTWFMSRERSRLTSLGMSYLQETKCVVPRWSPTFGWPVFPLWPRLHIHIVSQ